MKKRNSNIEKLYSQETGIKKYDAPGGKTVVIMPSHVVKKDLSDYDYGKDIDEKVIKMATQIAEKMAVSMLREMTGLNVDRIVDKVIEGVTAKIEAAIPSQQTIIREVVSEEAPQIKKKAQEQFAFEGPATSIDRSEGMELKGEIGKKTKKKGSLDEQIDALDNLF